MRLAACLALAGLATGCVTRSPEMFHNPDRLDRWARVAAIPPETETLVRQPGSETTEHGRFVRADDGELVIETNAGTDVVFLRQDVTRVSVVSGRPYRRYLGNGLRTGLLFGAFFAGLSVVAAAGGAPPGVVAGVIFGGGFYGAAAGGIAAATAPGTTVVFAAPDAAPPPTARGPRRPAPRRAAVEALDADESGVNAASRR